FRTAFLIKVIFAQIKFISLSVHDNVDASKQSFGATLLRDTLDAADAQKLDAARQLPALGKRNGGPNAGVRAGPESDRDAFNPLPFEPGGTQGVVDHSDSFRLAAAGFDDFIDGGDRPGGRLHDGDASLRGRKLKGYYLHN